MSPRSPAPTGTGRETETVVWLVELTFRDPGTGSTSKTRLCTAGQPVTVDADGDGSAETYEAAGKLLQWGGQKETPDLRGQGTRLKMSGVDQSIISTLLQNDFRNQPVRVWRTVGDPGAGTWSTPVLVHRGLMTEDMTVRESVPEDEKDPITAVIETRSTSGATVRGAAGLVAYNPKSYQRMLERAGISAADDGMNYVAQIRRRVFWGSEAPDPALTGENDGASAGGRTGGSAGDAPGSGPWSPRGPR